MSFSRVHIGSVAEFINGFPFKPDDWEQSGTRIIRIQNLTDPNKPFNRTTKKVPKKYQVITGELLVSWSATLGVFVWEGPDTALVNQHIFRVVPDRKKVHLNYFRHILEDALFEMKRHLHGATMKHVNRKEFLATTIPLPPLSEQKRIAGILDAADALRGKRRESLSLLDNLIQSTFLDMFGDPVTNPMEWEVIQLQKIGTSRLGKMLDKGKEAKGDQFPYLANFNVQWGRFDLENLRYMHFTEKDRKEFELKVGDLLVCEGGEAGRTAIWRGERDNIYFQKALHRIRLNPSKAIPEYVQQYMRFMSNNGGFRDFTNSATIAHLTGVKLKTLPLPLPPLSLQQRFATIVESIEKQKARLQAHLTELDTLFASLQQRAFNGEL